MAAMNSAPSKKRMFVNTALAAGSIVFGAVVGGVLAVVILYAVSGWILK